MKKKSLLLLSFSVPFLLSACQSVENVLSDSGMRQDTQQNVVVNPVPRATLPAQKTRNTIKTTDSLGTTSTPKTQPAAEAAAQQTPSQRGQVMVPNVAPSLGE
jgi:hypothetical protein